MIGCVGAVVVFRCVRFRNCVMVFLQVFRRAVCVAVRDRFPTPVVHVVWWHHIEQGVDPFPELCGFSLWWEFRLQRYRFDCSFQCDSGDARRDVCSPNLADVAPMPSARLLPQQGSCLFLAFVPPRKSLRFQDHS